MKRYSDSDQKLELLNVLRVPLSRRSMLKVSTGLTVTAGAATLLAACGDDDGGNDTADAADSADSDTDTDESATEEETDDEAADDSAGGAKGGRLIRGVPNDAENLDPHRRRTAYAGRVIQEMCLPVIILNPDLEYDPVLLDSWEVTDDGLIYTLNVREGLVFQDGEEINAEAVKISHERSVDDEATWPDQFYGASWEVIDEMTVEMTMPEANAGVMMILAFNGCSILSPKSIDENGGDLSEGAAGSGPFKFKEWTVNQEVVMERWDDYVNHLSHAENQGAPYADELVFRVVPDEQTQLASFESGEINVFDIPAQQVSNFEDNDEYELFHNEQGTIVVFVAPVMPEEGDDWWVAPFNEKEVRQAVAHAINTEEIIQGILSGLAIRNRSTMPTGNPGYTDRFQEDMGYEYNQERAMELLEEAGWVAGDDGVRERDGERLSILMRSVSTTTLGRISQLVQDQLLQVGFEVEYEGQERALFYEGLRSGEAQLVLMDYDWGEPDIVWWMGNDTTLPAGVYGDYSEEFQEVATEGWLPTDPAERADLYYQASQIMTEDAAMVPLYTPVTVTGVRSEVKNFRLGGQGRPVYLDASVEEE